MSVEQPVSALLQQVYDLCDEDTWEGENGAVLARQVRTLITSQTAPSSAGEQFPDEILPPCRGCAGGYGLADNAHTRDERCQYRPDGSAPASPSAAPTSGGASDA